MNWKGTLVMAVLAQTGAWALGSPPTGRGTVAVCMETGIDQSLLLRAETLASAMFRTIEVKLEWHHWRSCPVGGILVQISRETPKTRFPRALAYALPYEGEHIAIFLDRIKQTIEEGKVPALTAHVLVHEVTHMLQCTTRHSEIGIMKANWTDVDYQGMDVRPLAFTATDVELIDAGMKARATRLMAERLAE